MSAVVPTVKSSVHEWTIKTERKTTLKSIFKAQIAGGIQSVAAGETNREGSGVEYRGGEGMIGFVTVGP